MAAEKTLAMKFRMSDGSSKTLSVPNPKADLDEATVKSAMADIIAEDIFEVEGETMVSALSAVVTVKENTVLFE